MSITKTTIVDQITVSENGSVFYREVTRILEDCNQISQTFNRSGLTPASDLTDVPANVVAIANTVWTTDVVTAYQEQVAKVGA